MFLLAAFFVADGIGKLGVKGFERRGGVEHTGFSPGDGQIKSGDVT